MTDPEPEEISPEQEELESKPRPARGTEEWYRSEYKYGLYGIYWAISTLAFEHDITPRKAAEMLEYADNPEGEAPGNPWPSLEGLEEEAPHLRFPPLPPAAPTEGEPDFYRDLCRQLDHQRMVLEIEVERLCKGWAQMRQLLKRIRAEGHQVFCPKHIDESKAECTCMLAHVEEVLLKIEKESHE